VKSGTPEVEELVVDEGEGFLDGRPELPTGDPRGTRRGDHPARRIDDARWLVSVRRQDAPRRCEVVDAIVDVVVGHRGVVGVGGVGVGTHHHVVVVGSISRSEVRRRDGGGSRGIRFFARSLHCGWSSVVWLFWIWLGASCIALF